MENFLCILCNEDNNIILHSGQGFKDDLFETEKFNKKFDLIIMNHVLEHVTNPIKFLKNIKLKLSDNGVIYIAVQNMFKSFGNLRKYWFRLPHIFYFSSNTLISILSSVKLKPLNIKSGFELYGIFKYGKIEMNKGNIFFKQYSYIKRKLLIQDIKSNTQKLFQFLISLFPKNIKNIIPKSFLERLYLLIYSR